MNLNKSLKLNDNGKESLDTSSQSDTDEIQKWLEVSTDTGMYGLI
jgi:hypothetical protein